MKKVFKNLLVLAGLTATAAGLASCGFEDAARLNKTNLDLSNISFKNVTRNAGDNVGDITPFDTITGAAILPNNVSKYIKGVTGYSISYWDASNKNQLPGLPTEIGEYMCHLDLEYDSNIYTVKKSDTNILRCGFNIHNKVAVNAEDVKFDDIAIPYDGLEHELYATYLNEKFDSTLAQGIQSVNYYYLTKEEYELQAGMDIIQWKRDIPKEPGEYVANMSIITDYRWYVEDEIKSKTCNVTIYNEIDAANIQIPDIYVPVGEQANLTPIVNTLTANGLSQISTTYEIGGETIQGYPAAVGTYTIKIKTRINEESPIIKFKKTEDNTDDICYVQYHIIEKADVLSVGGFTQSTVSADTAYSQYFTIGEGCIVGTNNANKEKDPSIADVELPANQINLTNAEKITINNTNNYKSAIIYVLNNSSKTEGATVALGNNQIEFPCAGVNSKIQKVILPLATGVNELSFGQSVALYKVELSTEEVTTYNITFDANGHGEAPAAQEAVSITQVMLAQELTAEGYVFGGWYTDAACTTAAKAGQINSDVTLYAKWTEESEEVEKINYTLDLEAVTNTTDKAAVTAGALSSYVTYAEDALVYRYDSSKKNYAVEVNGGGKSFTITVPEGHTVTVSIGISSTGGDNYSSISVKNSEDALVAATNGSTFVPTKDANVYSIKGTTATAITYKLTAGVYTVTAVADATPVIAGTPVKAQAQHELGGKNYPIYIISGEDCYYKDKKYYKVADDTEVTETSSKQIKYTEDDYLTNRGFRVNSFSIVEAEEAATSFKVTYNTNLEGVTAPTELTDVTALPAELPTLVDANDAATFVGWFKDAELTQAATAGEEITANTNLYAKWTTLAQLISAKKAEVATSYPAANYVEYKAEYDAVIATIDAVTTITALNALDLSALADIVTEEQINAAKTKYNFVYATPAKGETMSNDLYEGLTITGTIKNNQNSIQASGNVTFTFTLAKAAKVTVVGYSGYSEYNIGGRTAKDTYSKTFEAGEVTVELLNSMYIVSIEISPLSKATAAATVSSITASGAKTEFTVGDEFATGSLKVKATYSDGSYVTTVDMADVTVNSDEVVTTAAGTYTVTVSYAGVSATYEVEYTAPSTETAITKTVTYDLTNDDGKAALDANTKIITSGISRNGDNSAFVGTIEFEVKAGAVVMVAPYKNYGSYTVGLKDAEGLATQTGTTTFTAETDCTVVITGLAGNYISGFAVVYPSTTGVKYALRTDNTDTSYTDITSVAEGKAIVEDGIMLDALTSGAKIAPRANQWAQYNKDTEITVVVGAGQKLTVVAYDANYSVTGVESVTSATTSKVYETQTIVKIKAAANTYIGSILIENVA